MTEFTQVATIPKTAQRCKAEGIGLSENQLRTLCARGELKHTQMGTDLLAQPLRAAGAGHAPRGNAGGVWENPEDCGMRSCAPGMPVRGRTGQAAFLPAAEAGWTRQNQRRGRALAVRSSAAKAAGPWPDWTSRLSAYRRGGMDKTKPAARACAGGSIKRGESRRSRARIVPRGHAPRIVPRGHAPRIDSPGTGRKAVRVWKK